MGPNQATTGGRGAAGPVLAEPGRRVRSLVALILRVGLGLQVFNAGLAGYLNQSLPPGFRTGPFGAGSFVRLGIYPGSEGVYQFVPYVQIVAGLALMLGFFTTVAAAVAGVFSLFPSLAQAFVLTTSGLAIDPFMPQNASTQVALNSATSVNLLLAAAVLWLSSVGDNAWSLDGLMLARGAVDPAPGAGEPARWPEPAAPPAPPVKVEFDPEFALGDEPPRG